MQKNEKSYRNLPAFFKGMAAICFKQFWHQRPILGKIKPLEHFTWDMKWNGTFNAPEPCYHFCFVNIEDGIVGEISGGMSPLHDTFYLFELKVPSKHQGKYYELSILANIAQRFRVPITAMHDIDSSFWAKMQRFSCEQVMLKRQIKSEEMDREKQKWHHLFETIHMQQRHAQDKLPGNWINLINPRLVSK